MYVAYSLEPEPCFQILRWEAGVWGLVGVLAQANAVFTFSTGRCITALHLSRFDSLKGLNLTPCYRQDRCDQWTLAASWSNTLFLWWGLWSPGVSDGLGAPTLAPMLILSCEAPWTGGQSLQLTETGIQGHTGVGVAMRGAGSGWGSRIFHLNVHFYYFFMCGIWIMSFFSLICDL